jgi:hypothetical protein
MPRRALNGLTPVLLIGTTDSTGTATVTIPAGRMYRYEGCVASPKGAATPLLSCHVVSEPTLGANLSAASGTITVQVSQSKSTAVLVLNTMINGLTAAGSGIPVMVIAWGE